ncbi:MAG: acyl esterase [Pyrinomonadaceae bacterium]|nr:acyl esterase [Sphingobacteriaceae bacterium]
MPQRSITALPSYLYKFSICTLVTNYQEYQEMVASFVAAGFTEDICEYLYADNSEKNTFEAFGGINRFLQEARGQYVILCHQDILLLNDNIAVLENLIEEIDNLDSKWAVLTNAGGINLKHIAMHVTQKSGNQLMEKLLPLKAITADENFILVKNAANLTLSSDLSGFHLYGTDMCLIAETLGFSCYIIDFRLLHKSNGNADKSFYEIRKNLKRKYSKAFRSRFLSTTITRFYISGNSVASLIFNTGIILFLVRQYFKLFKPKRLYHPKSNKKEF